MLDKRLLLALSLVALVGLAVLPVWTGAAPTVRLPAFTVLANGTPMGSLIGFSSGNPAIAMQIAGEPNLVPLHFQIISDTLRLSQGCDVWVQYDGLNCTGNAYVRTPNNTSGASSSCVMLGTTYAVGPDPTTGNMSMFKSNSAADANPQPTIQSRVVQGGSCAAGGNQGTVTAASTILDIDTNFPPPYTMQ